MRVFSGIQPTRVPHLGNLLGAVRQWARSSLDTADPSSRVFCVVDLHALTTCPDPEVLRSDTRNMAAALIACGLDPSRITLYRQSSLPQHAQLGWVLSCLAPIGRLDRMTQWKQKRSTNSHLGLFAYPVLQAADILLFKTTHVPVGNDQLQHLELARDIAQAFNRRYAPPDAPLFPLPQPFQETAQCRIMSLTAPFSKMSKSDPADASRINFTDSPDVIQRKLKRAVSANVWPSSLTELIDDSSARGLLNLFRLYTLLLDVSNEEEAYGLLRDRYQSNMGGFKTHLADQVIEYLNPIQKKYNDLIGDMDYVETVLKNGKKRASAIADETLNQVHHLVGIH